MDATGDLNSNQWQIADAIAYQLAQEQIAINTRTRSNSDGLLTEAKKVISYLQDLNTQGNLFDYLEAWIKFGKDAGHGNSIVEYYKTIRDICQSPLNPYAKQPQTLLEILGWAVRLSKYYKAHPEAESAYSSMTINTEAQQVRQEKVKTLLESTNLGIGKEMEANVLEKKKGKKVKYEIAEIAYEEKEPKHFNNIPESGKVIVEIKSLKDDGSINHVKFVRIAD